MITCHSHQVRKPAAVLLAVLLCALTSGCLNFENQTIVMYFPKDGSEIRMLVIYEGLIVGTRNDQKPEVKDTDEAMDDLEELVRGDAVILGDRFFRLPLKPRPKEKIDDEARKVLDIVKPNVSIARGQFIKGKDGKLSYCQPVVLREPHKVLDGLNKLFSEAVLMKDGATQGLDDDMVELFKKSARAGFAWSRFEKGRLSVTLPGNPRFFVKLRQAYFDPKLFEPILQSLDNLDKGAGDQVATLRRQAKAAQALLAAVGTAPISLEQRRDTITIALGYGDNEPFQVVSPFPVRTAMHPDLDTDLRARAGKMGVPVRDDVTIADVASAFQRTGQLPKPGKD